MSKLVDVQAELERLFVSEFNETIDFSLVAEEQEGERIAVIRTSDRNAFRQCRRKWAFSSHLRGNIGPIQNAAPLWFGTGFHFVMEDYHGLRRFHNPLDAWDAYHKASLRHDPKKVPDDHADLGKMAYSMLSYYLKWEERRKASLLPTLVIDGVPQVEVNFRIDIPLDPEMLKRYGYDKAVYSGTIDRVVWDPATGLIWLLDYKTAKMFQTQHFMTDSQITTYCWAASEMYPMPVAGMIYAQHLKTMINPPKPLKSGKLSTAANQRTSHILYREGLIDLHGSVAAASVAEQDYLNKLAQEEDDRYDKFIRYDYIPRSQRMQESEGVKILMECEDMLNPDLPLYPNPSRDCAHMCSFNSVCISMDDGSDYEDELRQNFAPRPAEYDGWREAIVWPEEAAAAEAESAQRAESFKMFDI